MINNQYTTNQFFDHAPLDATHQHVCTLECVRVIFCAQYSTGTTHTVTWYIWIIACPIPLVCMKLGRKSCSLNMEMNAASQFAASGCCTSSRQLQPKNLPAYTLWQCNPCDATQTSTLLYQILYWFAWRLGENHVFYSMLCTRDASHCAQYRLKDIADG